MIDGIIPVYKEKGWTSFDVVAKIRNIFQQKKVGHTGTLDPDATGVLPICLGKATKLVDFLNERKKAYKAKMLLGIKTDTQDISGEITQKKDVNVSEACIKKNLKSFIGDYNQIPPMYSAVRVKGKRLYDLARQGITVKRSPRLVHIYSLKVEKIENATVSFDVECSKGTYIRTLINDAGDLLGCGACMSELERTLAAGFTKDISLKIEEIEKLVKNGKEDEIIIKPETIFEIYPRVRVLKEFDRLLYNGNRLYEDMFEKDDSNSSYLRICDSADNFTAVYEKSSDCYRLRYYFKQ